MMKWKLVLFFCLFLHSAYSEEDQEPMTSQDKGQTEVDQEISQVQEKLEGQPLDKETVNKDSPDALQNLQNKTAEDVQDVTSPVPETTEPTEKPKITEGLVTGIIDKIGAIKQVANNTLTEVTHEANEAIAQQIKMSKVVRAVIKHYRTTGEVLIPGIQLPDPMSVPDRNQQSQGWTISNAVVYGMSNYTIDRVNVNIEKKIVTVDIGMKKVTILGNYTFQNFLAGRHAGPFNVTLYNVIVSGYADLVVSKDGGLSVNDTEMDMAFNSASTDFKTTKKTFMSTMFEGLAAAAAPIVFEIIKRPILDEINNKVRTGLNEKLKTAGTNVSITQETNPVNEVLEEARKYVREQGYDPYHVKDKELLQGAIKIKVTDFWLEGLSNFDKVGDAALLMDHGIIRVGGRAATQEIRGRVGINFVLGNFFNQSRRANFTVQTIQVQVFVNQSIDIQKSPIIDKLDLYVGDTKVEMDKPDGIGFFIQEGVNLTPSLLRHLIVDAIEEPLKEQIQELLNPINIEKFVEQRLEDAETPKE